MATHSWCAIVTHTLVGLQHLRGSLDLLCSPTPQVWSVFYFIENIHHGEAMEAQVRDESDLQTVLDAITNLNEDPINNSGRCVTTDINSEESTSDESLPTSSFKRHSSRDTKSIRPTPYTKTKTRWRKLPNNEIKYLQHQVSELEMLLTTLHHSPKQSKLLQEKKIPIHEEANVVPWQLYAEINKRAMKAAFLENRKIRAMLKGQLRVAKAYQCAIDKHVRLVA